MNRESIANALRGLADKLSAEKPKPTTREPGNQGTRGDLGDTKYARIDPEYADSHWRELSNLQRADVYSQRGNEVMFKRLLLDGDLDRYDPKLVKDFCSQAYKNSSVKTKAGGFPIFSKKLLDLSTEILFMEIDPNKDKFLRELKTKVVDFEANAAKFQEDDRNNRIGV